MELPVGTEVSLRWDTTLTYTAMARLAPADSAILSIVNSDDGDRAFAPGLIASRFDVLSEVEARYQDFGARLSVAGWYDPIYFARTANASPATFNPASVPYTAFPRATRSQQGLDGEVLDAFVQAELPAPGGHLAVRLGQFALVWGESVFLFQNSIGAAMAPIDEARALASPATPTRSIYLPTPQASLSYQLDNGLSIEGVIQPLWRRDRLPGVASYFSTTDYLDAGGERLFTPVGPYTRAPDETPRALQGGIALRYQGDHAAFGLYAVRYDAKLPDVLLALGRYRLVFPSGIEIYGASFSLTTAGAALAGEISARRAAPLANLITPAPGVGPPRGDTLEGLLSIQSSFGAGRLWNEAAGVLEVAMDKRLAVTSGAALIDPSRTRLGGEARGLVQLSYYQAAPGLDLMPSLSVGAGLFGRSSLAETAQLGEGDATLALDAVLRAKWHLRLAATHFMGRYERQPFADRDFVAFTVQRAF